MKGHKGLASTGGYCGQETVFTRRSGIVGKSTTETVSRDTESSKFMAQRTLKAIIRTSTKL
jgi:hypothetical protein